MHLFPLNRIVRYIEASRCRLKVTPGTAIAPVLMSPQPHLLPPSAEKNHGALPRVGTYRRTYADFRSLENSLFSGDLQAARDAFTRLIADSPPLADLLSRNPFPQDNSRLRAFKELERCLHSGDLEGAKVAAEEYQ